jgi:hypothetical protein
MAAGKDEAKGKGAPRDPVEKTRLLAMGTALALLFPVLAKSGIWDPYELDAADLARRIAARAFGARGLDMPSAVNSLPTLTDLRMGELPFTSMALGFRAFGLHDWAGRLPLALWALGAVIVLFEFLTRLIDRRAGLYGVIALVTMPLFFMQARTMLGDVVTMSALTLAFCGLTGALLDVRGSGAASGPAPRAPVDGGEGPTLGKPQLAWLGVGALGLLAGFMSRGLLLGVAVPAVAVGVTWFILRSGEIDERPYTARDYVGGGALLVGLVAAGFGARAFLHATPEAPVSRLLGFALLKKPPTDSTFDLVIRQLGHALFPWSAFLPFAFGRLLRAPVEAAPEARDREIGVRVALLAGSATAYAAYAILAPRTGNLAFSAPAILAAVAAVALVDLSRGAPASRPLALSLLVLGAVLLGDILREPEKALAAFVVDRPQFPKSFEGASTLWVLAVFALFALFAALSWFEEQPTERPGGFFAWLRARREENFALFRELSAVWAGNLLFGAVVVEAALVGLGGMIFVGRRVGWQPVDRLPKNFADVGVNLWWVVPLAVFFLMPLFWHLRDGFRFAVAVTRRPRAGFVVVGALLAGGVQGLFYYPALAAQVSPKEGFESYARLARPGEPLALCSVRSRAGAYYAGSEVESFNDPGRAYAWLTERKDQRRWLLLKADDLPRLNQLYRSAFARNLPVIDGRSSQILLASNQLGDHANESPLATMLLDAPPAPAAAMDVVFDDQIEAFGWEVTDKSGKVVPEVVPARPYHLRIYYRVLKQPSATWKAFVHIDGHQRRYNGDHNVLDGKYPMNLWRPGDVVVDDLPFRLEPNFEQGEYTVYFGFFTGDNRLKVSRGPQHENRGNAGAIRVR